MIQFEICRLQFEDSDADLLNFLFDIYLRQFTITVYFDHVYHNPLIAPFVWASENKTYRA